MVAVIHSIGSATPREASELFCDFSACLKMTHPTNPAGALTETPRNNLKNY